MKKRKARLRGTKTAGKFEQKKLLERMEQILDNPRLVLPKTNKNDIATKIYDKVLLGNFLKLNDFKHQKIIEQCDFCIGVLLKGYSGQEDLDNFFRFIGACNKKCVGVIFLK